MSDFDKGPNCLDAQACRGDFWDKFEYALKQCGGHPDIEIYRKMSLEEVVNVLAQNGLRMTFKSEWHIQNYKGREVT